MVKSDKFPAEPTADKTADARITRGDSKTVTTESMKPVETDKAKPAQRGEDADNEKEIYAEVVKSERSVADIAAKYDVSPQYVFGVVDKVNARKK